jgi:hypothetical protein
MAYTDRPRTEIVPKDGPDGALARYIDHCKGDVVSHLILDPAKDGHSFSVPKGTTKFALGSTGSATLFDSIVGNVQLPSLKANSGYEGCLVEDAPGGKIKFGPGDAPLRTQAEIAAYLTGDAAKSYLNSTAGDRTFRGDASTVVSSGPSSTNAKLFAPSV